ncbi:MAG: PhoH family protein [Bacillota bacterium]
MSTNNGAEAHVLLEDNEEAFRVLGRHDQTLKAVEKSFQVKIVPRGNELIITGDPQEVERVATLFHRLQDLCRSGNDLGAAEIRYAIELTKSGDGSRLRDIFTDVIVISARGKQIKPRTLGQKEYVEAIRRDNLVFGIGPAGTGKTFLAVACAVRAFKNREVGRIILTRPAVEAGERLGFLPGDIQEKVNPYLRPLYDALFEILGMETFEKYVTRGLIEIAPLAYMRGRTLDDSFVILDEAQNTTSEQMKMFLTRLGVGSRAVVTGDITQVDLPKGISSGLDQARGILRDIEGISFTYLTDSDVVRHELVQKIIKAYERFQDKRQSEDG